MLAEQIGTLAAFARDRHRDAGAGRPRPDLRRFGREQKSASEARGSGRHLRPCWPASASPPWPLLHRRGCADQPAAARARFALDAAPCGRRRACRTAGDGWLTGQNAPPNDLKEQLETYRESAARAGRRALPVLRRDIFVGASDAEADAVWTRSSPRLSRTGRDTLLVGGRRRWCRAQRVPRDLGFEHVMVRHITGDHVQMLESFGRIGRHVMPAIRDL